MVGRHPVRPSTLQDLPHTGPPSSPHLPQAKRSPSHYFFLDFKAEYSLDIVRVITYNALGGVLVARVHDPGDCRLRGMLFDSLFASGGSQSVTSFPSGTLWTWRAVTNLRDVASKCIGTESNKYSNHIPPQHASNSLVRNCWVGWLHSCSASPIQKAKGSLLRQLL